MLEKQQKKNDFYPSYHMKKLFQKLLQFTPKIPFNSWIVPEEIRHQSTNCRGLLLPARPRRKRKSNSLWTLVTRKRRCHEYHQPTRRRNWEPRTIKHESIRTTVNFTRFEYHPQRGQTPLVNLVQVIQKKPLPKNHYTKKHHLFQY